MEQNGADGGLGGTAPGDQRESKAGTTLASKDEVGDVHSVQRVSTRQRFI